MNFPRLIPISILAAILMACGGATPTPKPDPVPTASSAPTLVSHTPTSDATDVSGGTDLTLTFSKAMNTSKTFAAISPQGPGVGQHWLNGNTTLKIIVSAQVAPPPGQQPPPPNIYSSNTKFTVTAQGEDESGKPLTGNVSFDFSTQNIADVTAPSLLSTIPDIGAKGVPPGVGKTFTATFSEKMAASTLGAVSFSPNVGATNCAFTDSSDTTVQCTPSAGLAANTAYTMSISTAAKDVAGNAYTEVFGRIFNTGPTADTTQPKISSAQPSVATPLIDINAIITVYFSEAMDKAATQAAFTFISPLLTATESVSFAWNPSGTTLFIKRSSSYAYGSQVTWSIGPSAKDVSGNLLEFSNTAARSFKVFKSGSFKLYSDGTLDGQAKSNGVVNVVGNLNVQAFSSFYTRAFVSFDLQQLPSAVTSYTLQSATLNVYQQAVGCTGEYTGLGNVVAENISYALLTPVLFSTFFDTAPVSSGTTDVLATTSTLGYKTMDASKQVLYDVLNNSSLLYRSQWRLRFGKESNGTTQNCGDIAWSGGTAAQSERPYLKITYLYP